VASPMIVNGARPPDREYVGFHVTPNAASVTVIIQPDLYETETAWNLTCEGVLFASVPLSKWHETWNETIMGIQENSACEFVIMDAFGDGICCDAGESFYRLYYGENITALGALIAEGGEFELEERWSSWVLPLRPWCCQLILRAVAIENGTNSYIFNTRYSCGSMKETSY